MIGKLLLILGRVWAKCDSEYVWFLPKNSWRVSDGGSSGTPGKLCDFYPHLSLQTLFPVLNLPQNCYIMTTASLPWKTIFIIWQNMKAKELQKSQFPDYLVNWENFEVQSRLIFQSPNFQSLPWIEKYQQFQSNIQKSRFSISLWIGKNLEVQPKSKIQKSQFWSCRWTEKSYVLI